MVSLRSREWFRRWVKTSVFVWRCPHLVSVGGDQRAGVAAQGLAQGSPVTPAQGAPHPGHVLGTRGPVRRGRAGSGTQDTRGEHDGHGNLRVSSQGWSDGKCVEL